MSSRHCGFLVVVAEAAIAGTSHRHPLSASHCACSYRPLDLHHLPSLSSCGLRLTGSNRWWPASPSARPVWTNPVAGGPISCHVDGSSRSCCPPVPCGRNPAAVAVRPSRPVVGRRCCHLRSPAVVLISPILPAIVICGAQGREVFRLPTVPYC